MENCGAIKAALKILAGRAGVKVLLYTTCDHLPYLTLCKLQCVTFVLSMTLMTEDDFQSHSQPKEMSVPLVGWRRSRAVRWH